MTHIVTGSGFEWDVNPAALGDFEYIDALARIQKGQANGTFTEAAMQADPALLSEFLEPWTVALNVMLSQRGARALMLHLRQLHDGVAPIAVVISEIGEIITQASEKKS